MPLSQSFTNQIVAPAKCTFKPGSIKSIKLINFMCHDSFELTLGPRVNFIIGPNGSGKSALLTAIVVAFGGRATITQRAKKNEDFVMYGKRQAKVSIVIHNYDRVMEKDKAFKPDDYGKVITIEKIITKGDASTKLVLKNDKDKKVSERKQELDELLEHFGILINNPICILNQEVSKTFLHSKRPEDKFELFMKATNLEQIEGDYENAYANHVDWRKCNESKQSTYRMLDSEYNSCIEKIAFIENRTKLAQDRKSLNNQLLWGYVRDNEQVCEEAKSKLKEITDSIDEYNKVIESRRKKVKQHDEEIQIMKNKIESFSELVEEAQKKLRDTMEKENSIKIEVDTSKRKIISINRKITALVGEKDGLEKSIENERKRYENTNDHYRTNEQIKAEIEKLEKEEVPREQAREKNIRNHSYQLSESKNILRKEYIEANQEVSQIKNNMSQTDAILKRIKSGQENRIRKYGDAIVRLRDEIDKADRQNRFKRKPIGPLGYYLKIKNPDIATPLEIYLGRTANAFLCDNMDDMLTLNTICRTVAQSMREFRKPLLITRPFGRRHDVTRFKSVHPRYKTFLDLLEFENDDVFNCLVDRNSIENILYIPNYDDAEELMLNMGAIPQNTRLAFTKDCYVFHPRTAHSNYKAFASDQKTMGLFMEKNTTAIKELETELNSLATKLRQAEAKVNGIRSSMRTQDQEYDANQVELRTILAEIRKKEERLLNLKSEIIQEPQEIAGLEEDLNTALESIAKEERNLEVEKEVLAEKESSLKDVSEEKKECRKLLDTYREKQDEIRKSIESSVTSKRKALDDIKDQNTKIEARSLEKAEQIRILNDAFDNLAKSTQQTLSLGTKPQRIRKTSEIQDDLKKIDRLLRIEQDESRDPQELMDSLKKRMKEIESINDLKAANLENFSLTTKSLDERKAGYIRLRGSTVSLVCTTFSTVMRTMKMHGELQIHLDEVRDASGNIVKKARTLDMRIDTNHMPSSQVVNTTVMSNNALNTGSSRLSRSQPPASTSTPSRPKRARTERGAADRNSGVSEKENGLKMTDTRSLSGGERSFSTVAFVLALWHHCPSPFKLMDEIDVFMDMVTRRISYSALIKFAQNTEDPGQFIFFSPLELPKFDNSGESVRVFEMPAIVRKQPVPGSS